MEDSAWGGDSTCAPFPAASHMPYRLGLFDFDGTLADSFPCFLAAMNDAAARFGFRAIRETDLERLRGCSAWQVMEYTEIPMWQAPMITEFVRRRMADAVNSIGLFPGIHEALEDLAAREVRLAIVSSNAERAVPALAAARPEHVLQRVEDIVSVVAGDVTALEPNA